MIYFYLLWFLLSLLKYRAILRFYYNYFYIGLWRYAVSELSTRSFPRGCSFSIHLYLLFGYWILQLWCNLIYFLPLPWIKKYTHQTGTPTRCSQSLTVRLISYSLYRERQTHTNKQSCPKRGRQGASRM